MILDDEMVVERSTVLIPGAADEGPGVLSVIDENLKEAAVPDLSWSEESVSTGLFSGMVGRRRDALIVTYAPTAEWKIVILLYPFGRHLHLCRLLVATPVIAQDLKRSLRLDLERERRFEVGSLDLFRQLDLAALVSLTRQAISCALETLKLDAVEAAESNLDTGEEVPE